MRYLLLLITIMTASMVQAQSMSKRLNELEIRTTRLENLIDNQHEVNLLQKISELEKELQELRGLSEVQSHELKFFSSQLKLPHKEAYNKELDKFINDNTQYEERVLVLKNNDSTLIQDSSKKSVDLPEQEQYQLAYELMKNKKYSSAIANFENFIKQWPDSNYKVDALFGLAEIYLVQWQQFKDNISFCKQAESYFGQVVEIDKKNIKRPEALLKLGIIAQGKGNWQQAEEYFLKVSDNSPSSVISRIAKVRLHQMHKEGMTTALN